MKTKKAIVLGFLGGTVGILCCVSPVVFVLLGLMSASSAIALGNTLYNDYKAVFLTASALFLGGAFYWQVMRPAACNTYSWRRRLNLLLVMLVTAVAAYGFWFAFTSWLEVKAAAYVAGAA